MITDLKHYVSHYKQIMPKELCERAMIELQSAEFEQHKFYNAKDNVKRDRSGDKELDVTLRRGSKRGIGRMKVNREAVRRLSQSRTNSGGGSSY